MVVALKLPENLPDPSPRVISGYSFNAYTKSELTPERRPDHTFNHLAEHSADQSVLDYAIAKLQAPTHDVSIEAKSGEISEESREVISEEIREDITEVVRANQSRKIKKPIKIESRFKSELCSTNSTKGLAQGLIQGLTKNSTKSELTKSELTKSIIQNAKSSYLFSSEQSIPNFSFFNQTLSSAANLYLIGFQPISTQSTIDTTFGYFGDQFSPENNLTNCFRPSFDSNPKSNSFHSSRKKLRTKLSKWKTITFFSSLQLSSILEILLSHIPPFWQAELRLGLQEALVNAVKHGNQLDPHKQIKVSFSFSQSCYWWIIEDQGIDHSSIAEKRVDCCTDGISEYSTQMPTLEQDDAECGRGIYILRQIFNRVHWDHQKHHLYLFKQINPFDLPCIV